MRSGYMPVRQLHGYWDSAEFSSASRIATGKTLSVFLCTNVIWRTGITTALLVAMVLTHNKNPCQQ